MKVLSTTLIDTETDVYDFTVDEDHNYFAGFGTPILIHNCHMAGAPCFSRVFNRVNVRRRLGLTATPKRKDGLMGVSTAVMGRIASVGTVASDLPELKLFETGVGASGKYSNWTSMVKYLTKMEERNRLILKQVFADLRADPRNCVLIPCTRREHIHTLIKMINAQADYNRNQKQEDWPTELAVSYYGKSDTNAVLNQIGTGRARVTVAMMSMIQYGLDVARWTHVYVGVIPTSNPYNVYQALNRVCTPYPPELRKQLGDKPPSVVRYMIDEMSASVFCFKKLFDDPDYGIVANLKGTNYFGIKLASVSRSTLERMTAIAAYPKSYSARDVGVNIVLGKTRTGRRRKRNAWSPKKNITRF